MRYTEIDGQRYEVGKCAECPFRDMGDDGYAAHCTYPTMDQDPENRLWIENDGISIQKGCPLREVKERKPCPFCGSSNLNEIYSNDEGDMLEKWMMEEANADARADGWTGYESWEEFLDANAYLYYVQCGDCHSNIFSKNGMEDAWNKWNKRV